MLVHFPAMILVSMVLFIAIVRIVLGWELFRSQRRMIWSKHWFAVVDLLSDTYVCYSFGASAYAADETESDNPLSRSKLPVSAIDPL
jgi:hypothetical protein